MDKNNRISYETFKKTVYEHYSGSYTTVWNDIEIMIKPVLSLKEMMTFVDNVVKMCFTEDAVYLPEAKDFAIKSCILEMYANFDLPRDVSQRYELIYCSDVVTFVIEHINQIQLNEIVDSSNEKLANLAQANIEAMNKQMNDLYNAFNNLQNQISNVFDNISPDDIKKFSETIENFATKPDALSEAIAHQVIHQVK